METCKVCQEETECEYVSGMYLCGYCKAHPLDALEVITAYYDTLKLKLLKLYRQLEDSAVNIEEKNKIRDEILYLKSLP